MQQLKTCPESPIRSTMVVDDLICWTRMQAESGQALEAIIARKELERRAGGGLFLWGVGNPPAVAISALVRLGKEVPIVFSRMKTRPKASDEAPNKVIRWRSFLDHYGVERPLPPTALVTSRGTTPQGPKRVHYALFCRSDTPLALDGGRTFDHRGYRNVGGRGAPIGASQVTALLRRHEDEDHDDADYQIDLSAHLTGALWARLSSPTPLTPGERAALDAANAQDDVRSWCRLLSDFGPGDQAETDWADALPLLA